MANGSHDADVEPSEPSAPRYGNPGLRVAVDTAAFLCELAMLVVLFVAGWSIGSGGLMSIALAVFYPSLAILIWSMWMAPRSRRRLRDPWRLVAQIALFAAVAVLASIAQHPALGVTFGVTASLAFAASRWTGGVTGGQST